MYSHFQNVISDPTSLEPEGTKEYQSTSWGESHGRHRQAWSSLWTWSKSRPSTIKEFINSTKTMPSPGTRPRQGQVYYSWCRYTEKLESKGWDNGSGYFVWSVFNSEPPALLLAVDPVNKEQSEYQERWWLLQETGLVDFYSCGILIKFVLMWSSNGQNWYNNSLSVAWAKFATS